MKRYYGTVFKVQREHSTEDIRRYMDDIRRAGLDIIVVWPSVYWWEDRTKPGYPYNTGRDILRYAEQIGLKVIMETAGQLTALEYAPDFVMKDEYYPTRFDGAREHHGAAYGFLNYFHPEVSSLVEKQLIEIATAYRDFPALYGYDIFNETMYESYDRYTLDRFRLWLKEKYGTIERLNDAWDRVYYDWSQIQFTAWNWASVMPTVDLSEFQKDAIGIQLAEWHAIMRAADPKHPTIADNLYSMLNESAGDHRHTDEWVTDESVDELGMSFYPKNCVPAFPPHKRWEMLHGFTSASKDGAFWVSELQTHNQSAYRPQTTVSVKELRVWTWECFAAGCRGIIYWKWHPFIKGVQTLGRGLVDYKGRVTPRTEEVSGIAAVRAANEALFSDTSPEAPNVAILYDRLNLSFHNAFTRTYDQVPHAQYHHAIEGLYRCLFDAHIPAAFVRPADVLSGAVSRYAALFVTAQLVLSEELGEALLAYARSGGTVVIDGKFGFIAPDGVMLDAIPGGRALQPVLGMDLADIDSEGQHITYTLGGQTHEMDGFYERQLLTRFPDSAATVLGTFDDGHPALMKATCGKGALYYLPTALWYGYHQQPSESALAFLSELADHTGMRTYSLDGDLNICVARGAEDIAVYAFNYQSEPKTAMLRLPVARKGVYRVEELLRKSAVQARTDEDAVAIALDVPEEDVAVYRVSYVGA